MTIFFYATSFRQLDPKSQTVAHICFCFVMIGISCSAPELMSGLQHGNITEYEKDVYDYGETISIDCDDGYQPVPAERVTCLEADGFRNIKCKGTILHHGKYSVH